jgi:hypothetical protein
MLDALFSGLKASTVSRKFFIWRPLDKNRNFLRKKIGLFELKNGFKKIGLFEGEKKLPHSAVNS